MKSPRKLIFLNTRLGEHRRIIVVLKTTNYYTHLILHFVLIITHYPIHDKFMGLRYKRTKFRRRAKEETHRLSLLDGKIQRMHRRKCQAMRMSFCFENLAGFLAISGIRVNRYPATVMETEQGKILSNHCDWI